MPRLIVYHAHPAQLLSKANKALALQAKVMDGTTYVDLYAEYPRFDIDIEKEQQRLTDHDVILFQFPLFWYSTPSIIKEWLDLVLEHGFAYGSGGTQLAGKRMMLAVTAAGPEAAYSTDGYQNFPLRTFLTPMEQTANLCKMEFVPPYVLYGALKAAEDGRIASHAETYGTLLEAIRDDQFDFDTAAGMDVLTSDTLPLRQEA